MIGSADKDAVASPCISICELDERDICRGCGRSLDEIARWPEADEAQRRQIVRQAQGRMKEDRSA